VNSIFISTQAYRRILTSAAEGNVNALRVWGGGIYLPDVFYDTCDELGILIALHDVMYGFPWFGGNESIPVPSVDQSEELKHSIRRLSSHPAILAWNGMNMISSFVVWLGLKL
jgi:beta-mannosidase